MERDKVKVIQIRANDRIQKECYIRGLKDSLKLYIQKDFKCERQEDYNPQDYYILSCSEELDNGIYTFEIKEQINAFSQVFVGLKQAVQAKTYLSNGKYLIKEYQEGFCVIGGTNIYQINFLENMIQTNQLTPYEFQAITSLPIGILKAYKKNLNNQGESYSYNSYNINTTSNTNTNLNLNTNTGIDKNTNTDLNTNLNLDSSLKMNTNTNQSTDSNTNLNLDSISLNNPHNEIYTLDTEQTIQLKAFIYEGQRTKNDGNITKNIIPPSQEESSRIQWAFKIVKGTYLAEESKNKRGEAFPDIGEEQIFRISQNDKLTSIPKGYVILEDKIGDSITLKLSDIFDESLLKSNPQDKNNQTNTTENKTNNPETLINKNIIFFAYDKNVVIKKDKDVKQKAYRIYRDNGKSGSKKEVLQDRITSIELKILKTRFALEFDGQSLILLENQRIIGEWKARSGKAIENLKEDSKENQERQRFCIPNTNNTSFYYDLYLHKEEHTKPIQEGEYFIKATYHSNSLDLKGIDLGLLREQKERFKEDICKTLQMYKIQENLLIPLKVQYQKES